MTAAELDARVGIVGTGTMGSMLAWQLARRGVQVLAFEQFSPGHDRGAVGGETRLFRLAYAEGQQYVPLLRDSLRLWRELEDEASTNILTQCGGLSIGDPDGDYIAGLLASARDTAVPVEVLSTAEVAERYPQHGLHDGEVAVLDEQAGYLRCEQAVLSAARVAERAGAEVLRHTEVTELVEGDDSVLVRTADGSSYRVAQVVVAAGSWAARFLPPQLASAVESRRVLLTWFGTDDIDSYRSDRFPIFIHHRDGQHVYGTPTVDDVMVKVAGAVTAHPVPAPEAVERRHSAAEIRQISDAVGKFLPGLHPEPIRTDAFTDLYTADERPLVGRVGNRIAVTTGHSGRGFKYAPGVAAAVADVLSGTADPRWEFMSPDRF
ncbi:N-methyl-L-tryptophan oxidase [Saccharopolyspora hirsuta]|uniref:N-methyl-L-tryptophan oxidase n=1 Tax=Saccharopolyspora hirsuta TaxID=1837 RepID=A0A5M7BCZ8_SACHI|nr:N-methyl-L-tryptophan oxidase [Saccharopolyspora hirsuta]KAA5826127.1 N-methyl-L-tryptophan oxidase [Saccharopolyspora hirsuta]